MNALYFEAKKTEKKFVKNEFDAEFLLNLIISACKEKKLNKATGEVIQECADIQAKLYWLISERYGKDEMYNILRNMEKPYICSKCNKMMTIYEFISHDITCSQSKANFICRS